MAFFYYFSTFFTHGYKSCVFVILYRWAFSFFFFFMIENYINCACNVLYDIPHYSVLELGFIFTIGGVNGWMRLRKSWLVCQSIGDDFDVRGREEDHLHARWAADSASYLRGGQEMIRSGGDYGCGSLRNGGMVLPWSPSLLVPEIWAGVVSFFSFSFAVMVRKGDRSSVSGCC